MIINNVIGEVLQQLPQPLWENWYIKEMIGSGSFSAVFRVEATRTKRIDSAALKIEPILPDERFASNEERRISLLQQKKADIEEESTIMYRLKDCPNVVSYEDEDVKEFQRDGKLAGYVFLIRMELLQNVYDLMNSGKLNTNEANIIRLGKEIGNGLKAAHDIGVIHRDVKPSNFFISETGTYKLGDFNIAKQTSYTRSFAGTEGYIAPEVYRAKTGDSESYTAQADIYSLGICLYQFMNDGMFPFEETELTETAIDKRMSGEQLPPPKNASEAFGKIILKACAYSPEDRYANMSEMLADLDKLESGRVSAYSEGAGFTVPTAKATVYADSESIHTGSETVYADANVFNSAPSKKSSKKFMIPIVIAAFLLLAATTIFAIIKEQGKNTDNDTVVSESSEISTEATSSSASVAQTTMAETTTTTVTTSTTSITTTETSTDITTESNEGTTTVVTTTTVPVYGTGWVFNGDFDMDGDGDTEHLEVYETTQKDWGTMNPAARYRVYEDANNYQDYVVGIYETGTQRDYLVYNNNTNQYLICHVNFAGWNAGVNCSLYCYNSTSFNIKVNHIYENDSRYESIDSDIHPRYNSYDGSLLGYYKNEFTVNGVVVDESTYVNYINNMSVIYTMGGMDSWNKVVNYNDEY